MVPCSVEYKDEVLLRGSNSGDLQQQRQRLLVQQPVSRVVVDVRLALGAGKVLLALIHGKSRCLTLNGLILIRPRKQKLARASEVLAGALAAPCSAVICRFELDGNDNC